MSEREIPSVPVTTLAGLTSLSDLLSELPVSESFDSSTLHTKTLLFHTLVASESKNLLSLRDDELTRQLVHAIEQIRPEHMESKEKSVAASRKNINKVNGKQKEILAEFMLEHPDLAKNKLQNCAQGKVKSQTLWRQLSTKLNSWSPPVKDVSSWRKVYADQKHNTKKKFSHNKASKKKTGGGPYEEIMLTVAEEQIVEAAGLTAAVAGLEKWFCGFGGATNQSSGKSNDRSDIDENNKSSAISQLESSDIEVELPTTSQSRRPKKKIEKNTKMELIHENIGQLKDWQSDVGQKLEKVIEIKERSLKVKEETNRKLDKLISLKENDLRLKQKEHDANMSSKEIDLKIKTLELEVLQQK